MTMIDTEVQSSLIESIGYEPEMENLYVRFKKGNNEYVYQGVPRSTYEALLAAESVGNFFLRNIKGKYETVKVT